MIRRSPRRKYIKPSPWDKPKIFQCEQHAKIISTKLQTFCEGKECIDIVLVAEFDNCRVHTHRDVLSASSDYFRGMFRSTLIEAKEDRIKVREIDGVTLKLIIGFMYTAKIELRCATVENVLRAADFFQMHTLVVGCCKFLGEHIDASNCLGIMLFAQQYSYIDLYNKSAEWTYNHWEMMYKEREFLQLSEEQLYTFIINNELNFLPEENLFFGIAAWLEYDRGNREVYSVKLLSLIRFPLLEPKFIIENRHLVCKTIESFELICVWLHWHISPERRLSQFPAEMIRPRIVKKKLAFINCFRTENLTLQTYNPELETWSHENLPPPRRERFMYRPYVVNGKRIAVGYIINLMLSGNVKGSDLMTKKSYSLPSMSTGLMFTRNSELDGDSNMYIVDRSYSGSIRWIHSVRKYNLLTNNLKTIPPTNSAYTAAQTTVLGGCMYHIGSDYKTMECYDPNTNQWTTKACRNIESDAFGIVGLGRYLYAVGGRVNGTRIRTVERYNPATDTWTEIVPLEKAMDATTCCVLNGRLIVCGKSDDGTVLAEYNTITSKWKSLASLLPSEEPYNSYKLFLM